MGKRRQAAALQTIYLKDYRNEIHRVLYQAIKTDLEEFFKTFEMALTCEIESVRILSLYGKEILCQSIQESIEFFNKYDAKKPDKLTHCKYEISIRFRNGDKIEGIFQTKEKAITFLKLYTR